MNDQTAGQATAAGHAPAAGHATGAEGDPRASVTLVVAIFGAVLIVGIVLGLQALFFNTQESERKAKSYLQPEELSRLRAGQLERLNTYHWVDAAHGVAAIPIDRAMELVVRDQGRNPAVPGLVTAGGAGAAAGAGAEAGANGSGAASPGAGTGGAGGAAPPASEAAGRR